MFPYPIGMGTARPGQAHHHVEGRGLAGAVGAQEPVDRSVGDREVDAVDGTYVAEVLDEALGVDRRLVGCEGHVGEPSVRE